MYVMLCLRIDREKPACSNHHEPSSYLAHTAHQRHLLSCKLLCALEEKISVYNKEKY